MKNALLWISLRPRHLADGTDPASGDLGRDFVLTEGAGHGPSVLSQKFDEQQ